MMPKTKSVRNKEARLVFALFLALSLLFAGCGGGKRSPPSTSTTPSRVPSPPSVAKRPVKLDEAPPIRVLLKANFRSVPIVGSDVDSLRLLQSGGGKIQLSDGNARVFRSGSGFRLQPRKGRTLKLDGVSYQGALEVFINPLGRPVIVNELSLETYLKGVVPNELSANGSSQMEALKALTIAARTFAFSSLGQNSRRGFDLYSDNRSQVYRGDRSEQLISNRAVEQTWGTIATYRNQAIVAFYSSTCGGVTADYQGAFQRPGIPYLQGGAHCPDHSSPHSSWEELIQISRIQGALDRVAGVGRLKRLQSLQKSRWGRTVEMLFVGDQGEKVVKGLAIRSALGLRSNWIFALEPHYDSSGYISEIHATGRGWGHGVGLCQTGTVELSRQGWSFEKILKHYYTGISLARRW